jgi:hypothetical protein
MDQPARTITVTTRRRAWFSRLTVTHPERQPESHAGTLPYDADRARELFERTATMPATKNDLKVVLTEYRQALHSLLTARP